MRFPKISISISPKAFERLVFDQIRKEGRGLDSFRASHREVIKGIDGEYEIDVTGEFSMFGALFRVLIECKKQSRPVERETVQILYDRLCSTGAHKAMLFTTSGFQKGALEYAKVHGIALVVVRSGSASFRTNSKDPVALDGPEFSLWRCSLDDSGTETWSSRENHPFDPFTID